MKRYSIIESIKYNLLATNDINGHISKDNTCTSKEVVGGYYRLLDPCGENLVGTREPVNSSVGIKTVN